MKICVIDASNPNGPNDYYYNFKNYDTHHDGKWRSYHSYAACLGTEFFPYEMVNKAYKYDGFIVLVDKNFDLLNGLVSKLKMTGKKVFVGYHESAHLTDNIRNFFDLKDLKRLVSMSDGYWNLNEGTHKFFEGLFDCRVVGVPTAVPFDKWDISSMKLSRTDREGIIIGTRTVDQSRLKRNTVMAVSVAIKAAKEHDTFVTYMSEDDPKVDCFLKEMFGQRLRIIRRKKDSRYIDWLWLISRHKTLFQMDSSRSHGQVVSDAVLVDVPPIAGACDNSKLLGLHEESIDSAYHLLDLCLKNEIVYDLGLLKKAISFDRTRDRILEIFEGVK